MSIIRNFLILFFTISSLHSQSFMVNVPARQQTSLNGKWKVIIDPVDVGIQKWKSLYKDKKPKGKSSFVEYSFDGGPVFDVPGDFNSQLPELKFYESTVWYKKEIQIVKKKDKRLFLYFDAVNYHADVYLNSELLGSHEGGFTPFQFEVTDLVKEGLNSIIVRVNNERQPDGVPAMGYDWINYGGITRDVRLIETPKIYIDDYFIQLEKSNKKHVLGYVKINGVKKPEKVEVLIPEAKIKHTVMTDNKGYAVVKFNNKLKLWSPDDPKLYKVIVKTATDKVEENIGFRTIETKGEDILLNGKSVFLKGINFHEENASRGNRAYSESDALQLLTKAKELGCNFIRTAHYPQNEHIVRLAEKMGFMLWEEMPVFQTIQFKNKSTSKLIHSTLKEMIKRDKNRCAVVIWSISNETHPGKLRTNFLSNLADTCRGIDNTRFVSSALHKYKKGKSVMTLDDDLIEKLDVIGLNQYLGWYGGWPADPKDIQWESKYNKPMIISEYGAEAMYGRHGAKDVASSWSEEYQEQLYKDQLTMQKNISFLRGTCAWILFDFRSSLRLHPTNQNYWNRKGLLSEKGYRKKAWYVLNDFYKSKKE
ncbi:beta-glucuronidase [Wenyingzhuangia heitensis]|uniref:Beta-glucuronidase n=1 Tax=Wenyingzhuangia heitensis TaxID=1487859 RepID=A0ABX0U7K8_9FLAO|nr:glycoside hydrolase family 2 TIM barrel-domain containing protein [Wenyingzhuangia heitensis]NIJ44842.1 beta-glucuronidase [Wenyingzhuangia heitensis]